MLNVFLKNAEPKVCCPKFMLHISSACKWCSVKQMTWGALWGSEIRNLSILLVIPRIF
jgi:hypothetical protein